MLEALSGIAEQYSVERYEPVTVIVEEDRAAVMSDASFVQRSSGRMLRFYLVNFLRFRDGKIVEFRVVEDIQHHEQKALEKKLKQAEKKKKSKS